MRRRSSIAISIAVGLLVLAPTATAEKPIRVPLFNGPLTLTGVCPFTVEGVPVGKQNQKLTIFSDGRIAATGQLTIRVWNASKPENVWEGTASGPVFLSPNPDGTLTVKGTGTNLWYFFAGDLGPGEPGALFLVRGNSTEILDQGVPVPGSFEHSGYIENLCETLA